MKLKSVVITLLLSSSVWAQLVGPSGTLNVTVDPIGTCPIGSNLQYNTTNGKLWGCTGTWIQVGGSGGVTGFTAGAGTLTGPATSGTVSATPGANGIPQLDPSGNLNLSGNASIGTRVLSQTSDSYVDPLLAVKASYSLADYGAIANDSTDNATAVTNFLAAVNSYAGNGVVIATCTTPPSGKAYKTTAGFAFTKPTLFTGGCTIDYSGTGNAVTLGPTGLSAFPANQQIYAVKDITFIGGASAAAGIAISPYVSEVRINDNNFLNFGASGNYAVDANGGPVNEIHLEGNVYWVNDTTTGRNFARFKDSSGLGSVTPFIMNNAIVAASLPASFTDNNPRPCGGVGVFLGAPHAKIIHNSFYGFGANIKLANASNLWGSAIEDNALDSGACSTGGVNSNIQLGDGHTGSIDTLIVRANDVCHGTLFDKASDTTTVSLTNSAISQNTVGGGCTTAMTSFSGATTNTYVTGNQSFSSYPGWGASMQGVSTAVGGGGGVFILSPSATDNFNRADGTLGTNWTGVHVDGTYVLGTPQISSNTVIAATSGGGRASYYSGITFPSNQFSQMQLITVGSNSDSLLTNVSSSATTFYQFYISATTVGMQKQVAGTPIAFVSGSNSASTGPCPTNAYASLQNNNGTIVASCNGVVVLTYVDPSPLTGGSPGLLMFGGASANSVADNWSGGGTITDTSAIGAPSGACTTGSTYRNSTGTAGATFYVCEAGSWAAK